MIKPIVCWPDPFLLNRTKAWDFGNPPLNYDELEQDLKDTLQHEKGLGLAANQIGIPYRVLAIDIQQNPGVRIMYNPEILYFGQDLVESKEGCLSFPGIRLDIKRRKNVTIRWLDRHNYTHSMDLTGIDARCILHEIDHLNGIVFKNYVSELKFRRAWDK